MASPTDALALAFHFQQLGALVQAEQLYRLALEVHPARADAWCRLGEVYQGLGRRDEAVRSYRQALVLEPQRAEVHNNLGIVQAELGRLDEAVASFQAALRLQPDYVDAHNNLGLALVDRGQPEEGAACYHKALQLRPDYPEAHNNLGIVLARQQQHAGAVRHYEHAVRVRPEYAQAWVNLGNALRALGRLGEATTAYRRALEQRPDDANTCNELGVVLMEQGQLAEAAGSLHQAVQLRPDFAGAYNNLGLAVLDLGRADEAAIHFRQALYLQPDMAEAHNNLGLAYTALRLPDDALSAYQRAVDLRPDYVGALNNLGNACKDQGRLAEGLAYYRRALAVKPDDARIHSNLIYAMHYDPGCDPADILREARHYAERHAAGLAEARPAPRSRQRLRVGYVSPDYRDHPTAYFLEPILSAHDHQQFEVFCYADVPRPDAVTRRLEGYPDQWRSLVGLTDAQVTDLIRQDGIDILVDLNGHTGWNRLLVFARRAAPVQVCYLGYMSTTGLSTMDYRLTDVHADPPGLTEACYTEELIRLPECGVCYRPGTTPEVAPELPARRSGRVTLASLNNLAKVSAELLAVWARVLAAVPGSRLLLLTVASRASDQWVRDTLARHGVAPERVELMGRTGSRSAYLEHYQSADLCLDPFPYNGVTTTCDALWMGVPVVTLAGKTAVARQGVSILRTVGLDELVAETPEAYVRLAAEVAGDPSRLTALRSGLRQRLERSPLLDAARFTRHVEAAFREMWARHAAGQGGAERGAAAASRLRTRD
jgi:predicted O-linked N-acetylglucosamine transferase (SPINDLY family)